MNEDNDLKWAEPKNKIGLFDQINQEAPYPFELVSLVEVIRYRPGWEFSLKTIDRGQGSKGLTLDIITKGYDSYHQEVGEHYRVHHYMIVPAASYDRRSWQHWLFEQILLVERHEAMEFFQIAGTRPYAPSHGYGNDPYIIREVGTELDQRTSFRNTVDKNTVNKKTKEK